MPYLLGEKLRYLRLQRCWTQTELAKQLHLASHSHISFLESGGKEPSLDLVLNIAELFNVSTDYLLRDSIPVDAPQNAFKYQDKITGQNFGHFGDKLYYLRKKGSITQIELAVRLDLGSRGYISNLETGKKQPSPDLVPLIADIFNVTTDYLLRDVIPIESSDIL